MPTWAIPILIAVNLAAGASARLGRPFANAVVAGGLAIGLPILLLNGLVFPGGRDIFVSFGPLAVTREGLELGLVVAGRLLAALAAVAAFLLSTRPDDLVAALVARGASPRLAHAVLVAILAIPRLDRHRGRIVDAARTRGLRTSGSIGERARALRPIAGALAVGALLDVRDRTLALESRGFSSGRAPTAYRQLSWRPLDATVSIAAVVFLLGLVAVAALRLAGNVAG